MYEVHQLKILYTVTLQSKQSLKQDPPKSGGFHSPFFNIVYSECFYLLNNCFNRRFFILKVDNEIHYVRFVLFSGKIRHQCMLWIHCNIMKFISRLAFILFTILNNFFCCYRSLHSTYKWLSCWWAHVSWNDSK